jgi:gamma-glutamylcyclotransferase (GGCT)/AIG2-like uncharacterized protein YtfP
MEYLFSYGTLQTPSVQLETFGRLLTGHPDILSRYQLSMIKIEDQAVVATSGQTHHPIIKFTNNANDIVEGDVFEITETELKQADQYEVDDYKRINVQLDSGKNAWVYIAATT